MEGVTVRECTRDDIDAVCRLETQWAEEEITYGCATDSRENWINRLGRYCLVAEVSGDIVGFVSGSVHASEGLAVTPAGQRYLEVDDQCVVPDLRSRGIGSRLLDDVMRAAESEGKKRAHVFTSTKETDRVLKFYRGHGFRPWGVQLYR
jgi:ribosomal protein S18 acetylase RimI-like enzyme